MKFSENWLREFVNPQAPIKELTARLTMAGLEVDSVTSIPELDRVVIGEVTKLTPHPDADKLKVAAVNTGDNEPIQIVCGALNVYEGMKTPAALIGAVLPGGFKIKKAKLRGIESFGMLCSAAELGLAAEADGIMDLPADARAGEDINKLLSLPDNIIELDLTPNRGDCLSINGIARELGVSYKSEVMSPDFSALETRPGKNIKVNIDNPAACPRYFACVIEGINPGAETPLWMKERLSRAGIRSLTPVVDVTNFIMLELGQPMHAFDLSKISGKIVVRDAGDSEELTLIGGEKIKLASGSLIIADDKRPLALAGIMGGEDSAVSENTKDIVLECAYFAPSALAGTARSYGLATDSSFRFERGVDPALQELALNRAIKLLHKIVGGEIGEVVKVDNYVKSSKPIQFNFASVKRSLGVEVEADEVYDILVRLGCVVEKNLSGWSVTAPSWRFDLAIEADLIEEIARITGFAGIPAKPLISTMSFTGNRHVSADYDIKRYFAARGYAEAITYSFVSGSVLADMGLKENALELANPLTPEQAFMRTSILPGLIQAVSYNLNRQHKYLKMFESGPVFWANEQGPSQVSMLAGIILTDRDDFFTVKHDLSGLVDKDISFVKETHPMLHPGKAAKIIHNDLNIGKIGVIHPKLAGKFEVPANLIMFEVLLTSLKLNRFHGFIPPAKFPTIRRDLSVVVSTGIPAADLVKAIKNQQIEQIEDVFIFDYFRGGNLKPGTASLSIAVVMGSRTRTMEEKEVETIMSKVLNMLATEFNADLRTNLN